MKTNLIFGLIFTVLIVAFLLYGLSFHQFDCFKKCNEAEKRYENKSGVLQEMQITCSSACSYFLFDGKTIWFFNWRIK